MVDEINFGSSFGVIKARLTVSISCLRRIINHKCLPHFSFKTIKDIIFLDIKMKKGLIPNLPLFQIPVTVSRAMLEMAYDGIYPWLDTCIITNFCSVKQCFP